MAWYGDSQGHARAGRVGGKKQEKLVKKVAAAAESKKTLVRTRVFLLGSLKRKL